MDGLQGSAHSLRTLRLVRCNLTKIEKYFLKLINLHDISMQENNVIKIENLDNCRHLEKLWLCSNKISQMENLHNCLNLSELNLADNLISEIVGIDRLVNLEILDVSTNMIENLKDIEEIGTLPVLRKISFNSPEFEACPICEIAGYQAFILCTVTSPYLEVLYIYIYIHLGSRRCNGKY